MHHFSVKTVASYIVKNQHWKFMKRSARLAIYRYPHSMRRPTYTKAWKQVMDHFFANFVARYLLQDRSWLLMSGNVSLVTSYLSVGKRNTERHHLNLKRSELVIQSDHLTAPCVINDSQRRRVRAGMKQLTKTSIRTVATCAITIYSGTQLEVSHACSPECTSIHLQALQ